MKKYDFITIGGATEDITFYTREGLLIANRKDILRQKLMAFEYGTKIKIDGSHSTFGGGAANVAVSLTKLGFKTASLIAVGRDIRGDEILQNLKDNGVDTKLAQKKKNIGSGFSFLLVGNDNEHIVFSNRAANSELQITNYESRMLKKTKWIYVTSLSGEWKKVLEKVFSAITPLAPLSNGDIPKIAWNPGHIQLDAGYNAVGEYLKKTEVLLVNKDEAIELVVSKKLYKKKPFDFLNNIENLIKIIYSWGPKIVVITNGKYGACGFDGKKLYKQPIFKERKRVDTTGVGDAFGSAFVAGLKLYNGDIKKAMHLAARNSASVISKQGAQNGLLEKKDVKNL
jgi:ribokinase